MRYVSKIIQCGREIYVCSGYDAIIEISDENSSNVEILNLRDLYSNKSDDEFRSRYSDVFGINIDKNGYCTTWKVTKFDLSLYEYIDFIKAVRNPDAIRLSWNSRSRVHEGKYIRWIGPTSALKQSAYTLFYTDQRLVILDEVKNFHTLGAVLRCYFENGLRGEYINVEIDGDVIKVELYQEIYYYRICDLKNFNRDYTKCVVLGNKRG